MKNYIKLIFLLIATACIKEVDFPTEDTGKIYVNAIISDNGANSITVAVSSPFSSSSPANAEDVTVTMTVDGRLIDLTPDMECSTPEAVIYVPEVSFMAGQELVLSAATEGLPTVNARSVIPDKISETSITKEVIAAYKYKDPDYPSYLRRTLWEFDVDIMEEIKDAPYFGIQILRRKRYEYVGNVPDKVLRNYNNNDEPIEVDNLYNNAELPDNGTFSSIRKEMIINTGDGEMQVVKGEISDGRTRISACVEPCRSRLETATYNPAAGVIYEVHSYYEHKVILCRLSQETYDCLKARYILDNSQQMVDFGFTPTSYTYTNVIGGLGMFGAISTYESDWKNYE